MKNMEHFQTIKKRISENDPKLTEVRINYPIGDKEAKELAEALTKNSFVTTLNLRKTTRDKNNYIGPDGAKALADVLKSNTTIRYFDIANHKIGANGAIDFAGLLIANRSLENLNLSNNKIGDVGALQLGGALQHNAALKNLNLSNNKIGDVGALQLGGALQHNAALKNLNLSKNQFNYMGATSLAKGLEHNKHIVILNLADNRIGNEGAKSIAEAIQFNKKIEYLDLENNQIGDDGAKSLAGALQFNTNIEHLQLENNHIGVEGAQALKDALIESNITLYSLELTLSFFSDAGLIKEIEDLTDRNKSFPLNIAIKLSESFKQEQKKEGQDHSAPPEPMLDPLEKRLIAISPNACKLILEDFLKIDGISKENPQALFNHIIEFDGNGGSGSRILISSLESKELESFFNLTESLLGAGFKQLSGDNTHPLGHSILSNGPHSNSRD